MKNNILKLDIHNHTIASGHAFSTLGEIVSIAKKKEMKIIGISDHGPGMIGAPIESYFSMKQDVNNFSDDIIVLFGCEANILNTKGEIDISETTIDSLDYVLVGLHKYTSYDQNNCLSNTKAVISCIEKNRIFAISHPVNSTFEIEIDPVVAAAKRKGVALEINDRELSRCPVEVQMKTIKLIEKCGMEDVPIILSSDSHTVRTVGNFKNIDKIIGSINDSGVLVYNFALDIFLKRVKGEKDEK